MTPGHVPVLDTEVLRILDPKPGESVLDCTLGLGGHASAFLRMTGPDGRLIGIDADSRNLAAAQTRLSEFASRMRLHHGNFRDAATMPGIPVNIVFADLGLSSPHVDDPERGFTFRASASLDLRYDQTQGMTAAELILSSSEEDLATMFREFGEFQRSRALARELHARFHSEKRSTSEWKTDDLLQCVEKVFGFRAPAVLPQVFQALRIAVNDELGALKGLLLSLPMLLTPGGRCGIISYHSLEDRLVKETFRSLSTPLKNEMTGHDAAPAQCELLTRKPLSASPEECVRNPRARSARFRAIRFLQSPT